MMASISHQQFSERPGASALAPSDRNKTKNHTSKLQELALLLPVPVQNGAKKLTKKEILHHVLQYIQHLHRNIEATRALLDVHTGDGEGLAQNPAPGPARRRHATPSSSPCSRKPCVWGVCQKPQKKKPARAPENQTSGRKSRRCLALDKPERVVTPPPEQQGGATGETPTLRRCPEPCGLPKAASASPRGEGGGRQAPPTVPDVAQDVACCGLPTGDSAGLAQGGPSLEAQDILEGLHFLSDAQLWPRQNLVLYDSGDEVDKAALDADPWLPVCTPEGSPQGSPLALGPLQVDLWSAPGPPGAFLGLSPSLLSSPGALLPEQILDDGAEFLSQALFEDVLLEPEPEPPAPAARAPQEDKPWGPPKEPPGPCQPSVSLEHCYLSLREDSKTPSSSSSGSSSEFSDTDSEGGQHEDAGASAEGSPSSSDEDGDRTWTPTRRPCSGPAARSKARKGHSPARPKETKKGPGPAQAKKKCVNGFIMFCRMNRKQYIRACPGTASTAATKELAQLWREMTLQERRPYCTKARRFSRQHNRIVKRASSSSEDEDWETPKPFYQLLAEKARAARALAPAPHCG
ncbi:meiosis initiator protein [Oryctolagus cuniculus]|uniref:meiosis initiator protein n=1 Tax=Oryctolagus cuniculus TaxID=9986 RepID=UPI00387940DE